MLLDANATGGSYLLQIDREEQAYSPMRVRVRVRVIGLGLGVRVRC